MTTRLGPPERRAPEALRRRLGGQIQMTTRLVRPNAGRRRPCAGAPAGKSK
jgi:hypothetical protein